MITTITLNPAIDRIYIVDNFKVHKLHRLQEQGQSILSPGGKGVNIAISLQRLGLNTVAMGFAGGMRGRVLTAEIRKEGVATNFVFTAEETRTDVSIIDNAQRSLTEINESGHVIPAEEIALFMDNYKKTLNDTSLLIIAGSIPPKVENNLYAELVHLAHEKNIRTIVHTAPKFIEYAIEAEATIINPDMRSSHELFGKPLDGIPEFIKAGQEILAKRKKTEIVLFSHRIENVIAVTRAKVFILRPNNLKIVNMLGYGDAIVSGLAYGLEKKYSFSDALKFACACGLSNVESIEKQVTDLDLINKNIVRITVEEN